MYPGAFAATTPDKPAVIMGRSREVVTYGELDERSARLAQFLFARGLRPGDKIALMAENHPRFYEVYWAAMRAGLYLTAVNRYLAPAEAERSASAVRRASASLSGGRWPRGTHHSTRYASLMRSNHSRRRRMIWTCAEA